MTTKLLFKCYTWNAFNNKKYLHVESQKFPVDFKIERLNRLSNIFGFEFCRGVSYTIPRIYVEYIDQNDLITLKKILKIVFKETIYFK